MCLNSHCPTLWVILLKFSQQLSLYLSQEEWKAFCLNGRITEESGSFCPNVNRVLGFNGRDHEYGIRTTQFYCDCLVIRFGFFSSKWRKEHLLKMLHGVFGQLPSVMHEKGLWSYEGLFDGIPSGKPYTLQWGQGSVSTIVTRLSHREQHKPADKCHHWVHNIYWALVT